MAAKMRMQARARLFPVPLDIPDMKANTKVQANHLKNELIRGETRMGKKRLPPGGRLARMKALADYKNGLPVRFQPAWNDLLAQFESDWRDLVVQERQKQPAQQIAQVETKIPALPLPAGLPQTWNQSTVQAYFHQLRGIRTERAIRPDMRCVKVTHFRREGNGALFAFRCFLLPEKKQAGQIATPFWLMYLDLMTMPSARQRLDTMGWHMYNHYNWYPENGATEDSEGSCDEMGNVRSARDRERRQAIRRTEFPIKRRRLQ